MRAAPLLAALQLALLFVACSITAALAHAGLVSTLPADGARLDGAPPAVALTFTEPVAPIRFALVGTDGRTVELSGAAANGPQLSIPLPPHLGEGSYLLSWHVTSSDGHPVGGTLGFAIGQGAVPVTATASPSTLAGPIWVTRAAQYAALFFGLGSLAFGALTGLGQARRGPRLLALTGLLLVPVALGLQGLDLTGLPLDAVLSETPWRTALSSSYALTEAAFALAFALALLPVRSMISLATLIGLIAPSLSGHASTAEPQWLMRGAVALHMAALLLWLGALWPLAVALRQDGRAALRRFAALIPFGILALLASGLCLALVQLGAPGPNWLSPYALLLWTKLALVGLLLGLGLWNRVVLTPRALAGASLPLRRVIAAEIVVALAVLGLVAVWRFTPPPRVLDAIAVASAPLSVPLVGDMDGTLTLQPARAGTVAIGVTLAAPAEAVTLLFASPGHDIAALKREAVATDPTHWTLAAIDLTVGGTWQVTARVRTGAFDRVSLTADFTLPDTAKEMSMRTPILAAASSALLLSAPLAQASDVLASCPTGQTFASGAITVSGAFTRATAPGAKSAGGYFTVANAGPDADTLLSVTTGAAQLSGLHQMKMEGDVMKMSEVDGGLAIPAGGTLVLEPMGYHLMLTGLAQGLTEGQCVAAVLHFAKAGDIKVDLNVGGLAQQTPPGASAEPSSMEMNHDDMSGMAM